ncbi:uncharacterized protein TRIVIDRAFT_227578 [Trichoderma virens Gv29-8]|uniref:Fascin domain-containing protein n=1 Tax=Hypocrea virens (strain Gv29-8 / FGSC 10586) TaxID=413071 RepID=G9N9V9_HYPVG|nr:uncharacterized protein TRIVIDRAFT_227578 [Trichoderma virens Gv29-8]EHK16727.1 hypothetical protein TRIVIDRAFT_227578 [Trichoderma virens Gv29-8]UKZ51895.1 hypothetical protein TrVGV298_005660 [Trichoderma virens]
MSDLINIKDDSSSTLDIRSIEYHPIVDEPCMIQERKKPHRLVTLCFGEVMLLDKTYPGFGFLWMCRKRAGWYGFQNVVSGTYLGRDGSGVIRAAQLNQRSDEYFMAERHPDGGYILLIKHGEELWQVAISEDGQSLVEVKADKGPGTAWDFISKAKSSYS